MFGSEPQDRMDRREEWLLSPRNSTAEGHGQPGRIIRRPRPTYLTSGGKVVRRQRATSSTGPIMRLITGAPPIRKTGYFLCQKFHMLFAGWLRQGVYCYSPIHQSHIEVLLCARLGLGAGTQLVLQDQSAT